MRRLSWTLLLGLLLFAVSQTSSAAIFDVLKGSDFLTTQPGTTFGGVLFNGVPVGPGSTDTIVQRLNDVNLGTGGPSLGTTPLLMTQLELMSAVPTNFGLGVGFYFITLQSTRGGPATTGNMTINLTGSDDHLPTGPEGTFSSFFDVFFDIRFGAPNGPIAQSSDLMLTNSGALWDANPTPTDLIVPGLKGDVNANFHTNKIQNIDINDMDFFPVGTFQETHPTGAVHAVSNTPVPEPGTLGLVGGALLVLSGLPGLRRRLRH
jgi:hypothetical protein